MFVDNYFGMYFEFRLYNTNNREIKHHPLVLFGVLFYGYNKDETSESHYQTVFIASIECYLSKNVQPFHSLCSIQRKLGHDVVLSAVEVI